ncbi:Mov34/MPN/PAD-1 family protein [Cooperia oncophora]
MLGRLCSPTCSAAVSLTIRSCSVPAEKTLEAVAVDVEGGGPRLDISGLKPRHRVIAAGGMPPLEFEWERKRSAQRERFGTYGLKSGVDPSICWPTVEEIEEEQAVGLYREYDTCVREMKALKQKKAAKEAARIAELEKNLKKYPEVLAKYEASQVKAEKERDEKEIALENRIREIQEYFGYWMDPKDPRFEVMLQQKEQEEKKAAKLAKRAEMQKKKIAEIMTDVTMSQVEPAAVPCSTKKPAVPSVECSLHPLVIINMSEHWTRMRAQSRDKTAQKVFGAVLGKVDEGHVEMVNSFELRMFTLDGHVRFNEEFLRQRLSQYKEVSFCHLPSAFEITLIFFHFSKNKPGKLILLKKECADEVAAKCEFSFRTCVHTFLRRCEHAERKSIVPIFSSGSTYNFSSLKTVAFLQKKKRNA